jgi:hypothetical protein
MPNRRGRSARKGSLKSNISWMRLMTSSSGEYEGKEKSLH